jgi:hypothetical protein
MDAEERPRLTPKWLTEALEPHLDGAEVTAVDISPVGTGQMASCLRLGLSYDRPTPAPDSLVAKVDATDERSRMTAIALGHYAVETGFYREVGPTVPMRTPRCYLASHEPGSGEMVLLLEDMADSVQGDQLAGCSLDDAAIAVAELTKLHAPYWESPELATFEWLQGNWGEGAPMVAMLVASLFDQFVGRLGDRIDPEVMALAERLVGGLEAYLSDQPGPRTIVHADYRLDNMLFGRSGDAPPVTIVDWQTVCRGPGIGDLAYFIGAGLLPDDRREHEQALVADYLDRMRAGGVELDEDEAWHEYRRYTFLGLIMAITAQGLVVETERGDDMFGVMAQRHGLHALDLDATEFLN